MIAIKLRNLHKFRSFLIRATKMVMILPLPLCVLFIDRTFAMTNFKFIFRVSLVISSHNSYIYYVYQNVKLNSPRKMKRKFTCHFQIMNVGAYYWCEIHIKFIVFCSRSAATVTTTARIQAMKESQTKLLWMHARYVNS